MNQWEEDIFRILPDRGAYPAVNTEWFPPSSMDDIEINGLLNSLPPELSSIIASNYSPEARVAQRLDANPIPLPTLRSPTMNDVPMETIRAPRTLSETANFNIPHPQTVRDLAVPPYSDEEAMSMYGPPGASGVVNFGKGGAEALAAGTPYKSLIEALQRSKSKFYIPEVPSTTKAPLVVKGEKLPTFNQFKLGDNVLGYYANPQIVEQLGFQPGSNVAGDLIASKPGLPDTIKHEHMHHLIHALTEDYGLLRDPQREVLRKELASRIFPDMEPLGEEARQLAKSSVDQVYRNMPNPRLSDEARRAILKVYSGVDDSMAEEEALTRSTGTTGPWERILSPSPDAKVVAPQIMKEITEQPVISDMLSALHERIPESAFSESTAWQIPPRGTGLPFRKPWVTDEHVDIGSLLRGQGPRLPDKIARTLHNIPRGSMSTNDLNKVADTTRSWIRSQGMDVSEDSPLYQAIIDYLRRR